MPHGVQRLARDTILAEESQSGSSGGSSGLSLAVRLQQEAPEAWAELVSLYGPLVDQWCRRGGVRVDSIADVGQDIFLTAFRSIHQFSPKPHSSFRAWLWTVARSRIVDHHRRQRQAMAAGGSTALGQLHALADPVPDEDPTEPDHWAAVVRQALDQVRRHFESSTWQLFWRATVLGHPTDLIAQENNVTSAAVRQAKSRVLRRLRKQLGDA